MILLCYSHMKTRWKFKYLYPNQNVTSLALSDVDGLQSRHLRGYNYRRDAPPNPDRILTTPLYILSSNTHVDLGPPLVS